MSLEIQNSNKIREEAGPALPPAENGASEPADDQPIPAVSKRSDRRASFVLRKGIEVHSGKKLDSLFLFFREKRWR